MVGYTQILYPAINQIYSKRFLLKKAASIEAALVRIIARAKRSWRCQLQARLLVYFDQYRICLQRI